MLRLVLPPPEPATDVPHRPSAEDRMPGPEPVGAILDRLMVAYDLSHVRPTPHRLVLVKPHP